MQRRIYGRLTKSAKKEAEDWARQTKRTLVMELIKQRKHTWISRPRRQVGFNFHKMFSTCNMSTCQLVNMSTCLYFSCWSEK